MPQGECCSNQNESANIYTGRTVLNNLKDSTKYLKVNAAATKMSMQTYIPEGEF